VFDPKEKISKPLSLIPLKNEEITTRDSKSPDSIQKTLSLKLDNRGNNAGNIIENIENNDTQTCIEPNKISTNDSNFKNNLIRISKNKFENCYENKANISTSTHLVPFQNSILNKNKGIHELISSAKEINKLNLNSQNNLNGKNKEVKEVKEAKEVKELNEDNEINENKEYYEDKEDKEVKMVKENKGDPNIINRYSEINFNPKYPFDEKDANIFIEEGTGGK